MKVVFTLFLLLPLFLVNAKEVDFSKIETLINTNAKQLQKEDVSSSKPLDKKRGADITKGIIEGSCPTSIDASIMSLVVKRLVSSKLDIDQAKKAFD